ncbi:hypothetical protein [Aquimarina sp. MMG016]|uniref:hypothetical protein n=1 Tax=Aquimarina sp. MMG016 TaxID=2822690 RepID=UPI001B39CEA4|nr:hypothetical protein [Aquimarina sp. MMG016]MBQ4819080.1 hypothetical protein [Aquimarina sp. MMG016]
MDKENIPEEIFELLALKDYEQLSVEERQIVEESIGADLYKDFKTTVLEFRQEDNLLEPKLEEPDFMIRKPSFLTRVLHYPIPAYQVAAVFVIIISTFLWSQNKETKVVSTPNNSKEILQTGTTIDKDYYPEDLVFNL